MNNLIPILILIILASCSQSSKKVQKDELLENKENQIKELSYVYKDSSLIIEKNLQKTSIRIVGGQNTQMHISYSKNSPTVEIKNDKYFIKGNFDCIIDNSGYRLPINVDFAYGVSDGAVFIKNDSLELLFKEGFLKGDFDTSIRLQGSEIEYSDTLVIGKDWQEFYSVKNIMSEKLKFLIGTYILDRRNEYLGKFELKYVNNLRLSNEMKHTGFIITN